MLVYTNEQKNLFTIKEIEDTPKIIVSGFDNGSLLIRFTNDFNIEKYEIVKGYWTNPKTKKIEEETSIIFNMENLEIYKFAYYFKEFANEKSFLLCLNKKCYEIDFKTLSLNKPFKNTYIINENLFNETYPLYKGWTKLNNKEYLVASNDIIHPCLKHYYNTIKEN